MYSNYGLFTVIMTVNLEFIREIMTFATYNMYNDFKTIDIIYSKLSSFSLFIIVLRNFINSIQL